MVNFKDFPEQTSVEWLDKNYTGHGQWITRDSYEWEDLSNDLLGIEEEGYDSVFVVIDDGDYALVYGMFGTVPYYDKKLYRLIPEVTRPEE